MTSTVSPIHVPEEQTVSAITTTSTTPVLVLSHSPNHPLQQQHSEPSDTISGLSASASMQSGGTTLESRAGLGEVEEEVGVQEETMVAEQEDGEEKSKSKGGGADEEGHIPRTPPRTTPSPPLTRVGTNESTSRPDNPSSWHPLQDQNQSHTQDADTTVVVVVEDGEVVDQNGHPQSQFLDSDEKPSISPSARRASASHLHLEIKPPSPQPWELIEPPSANGRKERGDDFYSTLGSQKFNTLQSKPHTRPLIPKSSYYFGPPASDSAYGTHPVGQIGVHHPREILRVERDYTGGELIQFAPIYPLELEGRITPTQFLETINAINERLISAHSLRHSFFDNLASVLTFQLSRLLITTHFEKEMEQLHQLLDDLNSEIYNPVGLNILWPRNVAFLYLEIEYY